MVGCEMGLVAAMMVVVRFLNGRSGGFGGSQFLGRIIEVPLGEQVQGRIECGPNE